MIDTYKSVDNAKVTARTMIFTSPTNKKTSIPRGVDAIPLTFNMIGCMLVPILWSTNVGFIKTTFALITIHICNLQVFVIVHDLSYSGYWYGYIPSPTTIDKAIGFAPTTN